MTKALIELRGIRRTFTIGDVKTEAVRGIDLSIDAGEFVAIVGQSGSGKSTIMNVLGLLDRPSAGIYRLEGRDTTSLSADERARLRRELFGFVFQKYHLISGTSARENAELPAIYAGMPARERRARVRSLLARLGLDARSAHRPDQLSGGQQQRVSIARALVNGGRIILADEPTGALDSENAVAVMDLLKDLWREGHTVILITHDLALARAAQRIIEVRDGLIIADSSRIARLVSTGSAVERARTPRTGGRFSGARAFPETFRTAFAALARNPVRTALTLLGIVIGTASVIAMIAVGEGTRRDVMARAAATGTDWIVVMPDNDNPDLPGGRMTLADAEALGRLPNVRIANPGRWTTVTLVSGNVSLRSEAFGTSAAYTETFDWQTRQGGFFTAADERAAAPVVVLGSTVAERLHPDGENPLGRHVLVNNIPFLVIGVLEPKGPDERGMDRDDRVVVPFMTAATRLVGNTDLGGIQVTVQDTAKIEETKNLIRQTLLERHRMEDFFINDMAARIQSLAETQSSMAGLLAAIAGISLLVGGIGIMNIMVMSVTERTREIGIRIAMGARGSDIRRQFLIEAVLLAGAGGAVGLALGLAIGIGASVLFDATVVFQGGAILLALLSAVGTGILFGYMPARKAARLDPVLALAHE